MKKLEDEGPARLPSVVPHVLGVAIERGDETLEKAGGPKYPNIKVKLTGTDGNAFMILGNVSHAMKRGGVPPEMIEVFKAEARSGDYDHLLQTCMLWVDVS